MIDSHRAAEGIESRHGIVIRARLIPSAQRLSLLAITANTVLACLEG